MVNQASQASQASQMHLDGLCVPNDFRCLGCLPTALEPEKQASQSDRAGVSNWPLAEGQTTARWLVGLGAGLRRQLHLSGEPLSHRSLFLGQSGAILYVVKKFCFPVRKQAGMTQAVDACLIEREFVV